jgi:hypothetical protein
VCQGCFRRTCFSLQESGGGHLTGD